MPDNIVISTPAGGTSHLRTVPMTGTFVGACTSVEASLDGRPFVVIDPAPAAGAWAGTYPYTNPGSGTLTVRWGNDHTKTAAITNVTVTSNNGVPAGVTGGSNQPSRRRL